ncbi:hypothetical protein [Pseudogemmobacter bohemicus]|uniref:hypothetical protein n=1 Tax=Pseudogemmobacter bohemicus TaxID=2250708 RepID=UPI000DD2C286|nr:hypothetical protein [Pseudogemmobacter bohemicus]
MPRIKAGSFGAAGTEEAGIIIYSLAAGSGVVGSARFEIDHRFGTSGSWITVSIPAANGGGRIEDYSAGDTVQLRARAVSAPGIAGPWTTALTVLIGGGIDCRRHWIRMRFQSRPCWVVL